MNEIVVEKSKSTGTDKTNEDFKDYMNMRLQETLQEVKRHFCNYIDIRNSFNSFVESKLAKP